MNIEDIHRHVSIIIGIDNPQREKLYNEIRFGLSIAANRIISEANRLYDGLDSLAGTVEFEIQEAKIKCLMEQADFLMNLKEKLRP